MILPIKVFNHHGQYLKNQKNKMTFSTDTTRDNSSDSDTELIHEPEPEPSSRDLCYGISSVCMILGLVSLILYLLYLFFSS